MRKTAEWTKGSVPASSRSSANRPQFTYRVEVPRPFEGKSLFETHCSLDCSSSSPQTKYVCMCARECIPEYSPPKTPQTMSVQVGAREGGKDLKRTRHRGGGAKEERKSSLLYSCCYSNPLDNTYSICLSGMKESDELTPIYYCG